MNIQRSKNIKSSGNEYPYSPTSREATVNNFNILPSLNKKDSSSYTAADFQDDMDFLDQKLNTAQRNINYWDIYKISASVTNADLFSTTWNSLTPNSAMIINTSMISVGDTTYNRGDVVLKDNDGNPILVKAENGGIFYPYMITKNDANQ